MSSWRDDVKELHRIHNQLVKDNGKLQCRGRNKQGWSIGDTAKHLGISKGKVSENLRLAKGLHKYPQLASMRERQEGIAFMKAMGDW